VAILGLLLLAMLAVGQATPVVAASPTRVDPTVGPHARDEARHANDATHFAPARSAIMPRRVTTGVSRVGGAQPMGLNASGGVTREVFGFAPYWALPGNANWNYNLLTTVAYFGLDINADGSISTITNSWTGWNSQDLVDTINRAHAAGDRVVVVIKAFDEATINQIVTTPGVTQTAITNTINAIASKNLDGVNVDFEGHESPSYPNIQSGFTNFMTQLALQVHQRWPSAMVSADTYSGAASWDNGIFKIDALAPVVDALFVMAYDMSFGNTPGHAGPNAPLNGWTYNDTTSMQQYLAKAPASKIILGVPYYGYKWSTTTNQPYGSAVPGTPANADTYQGVLDDFNCGPQQLAKAFDSTGQSPWATWWSPAASDPCDGNHNSWRELYYDDANSLGLKYDLVNANNLRGTGMWALGYDGTSQDLWKELALKFGSPWPGQYHALTPSRILDTRTVGGPVGPGQVRPAQVTGRGGVPDTGVAAVVLNVTVTNVTQSSYLSIYPAGVARPLASNLDYGPGQTVANLVEVPLGVKGQVSLYNNGGSANVILDVQGWISIVWMNSGSAGQFQALPPARILDTRTTGGPIGANQTRDLQVTGQGGVPAAGVVAVVVNLTVTSPTAAGYLTAYPSGATRPVVSNLNFTPGQTVPNRAVVTLSSTGTATLYNFSGSTHVVVDVAGWFSDSTTTAATSVFTGLPPTRILDTRTGMGGFNGVGSNDAISVAVAGLGGVPPLGATTQATAVVINVTVTAPTASSYLTVYPDGTPRPVASDLNYVPGLTVPNLVVVKLGPDGHVGVYNATGTTHVIIDVLGWYN
jgi:spore germination protein YaaH